MLKRKIIFSFYFLFAVILIPFSVFATWDGNPYSQGSTLNPECSPAQGNCTVSIPDTGSFVSSQWISVGSNISFSDGIVGVGSLSNNAKLNIDASDTGGVVGILSIASNSDLSPASDVVIKDDYAYVISNNTSVNIVKISNPTDLTNVTNFTPENPNNLIRLAISGNYLFISEGTQVEIVDITIPTNPVHISTWATNDNIRDVLISGDYMYLAEGNSGFEIIDISNINIPTLVASDTQIGLQAFGLGISGDYLYINSGSSGLWTYNVADKNNIINYGYVSVGGNGYLSGRMAISGNYLYTTSDTADANLSFVVFDITNPTEPSVTSYGNIGSYRVNGSVVVSGDYAYVGDGEPDSLYVFDVSNPNLISAVTHYSNGGGNTEGIALSGDNIFIAAGNSGLVVLTLNNNGNPSLALKTSGGDILISGLNNEGYRYLNFGSEIGSLGFGVRNNNGTMQFKNANGDWADFSAVGDSLWNTNNQGIDFVGSNVGIGTSTPNATLEISSNGSGSFVNGYPSLLNIHTIDDNPWGITFQNDTAGTDKEMGVFLNNNGQLVFGNGNNTDSLALDQSGHLTLGALDTTTNAKLNIRQDPENFATEQITNGDFNGDDSNWTMGVGWSYANGSEAFSLPNATGTIQSLNDITIENGGSGYLPFDHILLNVGSGNGDAEIEVLAISGVPNSFDKVDQGSGYQVNDILTIDNGNGDSAVVQVDTVDGNGAVISFTTLSFGTNYYSDVNYGVSGGSGSNARFAPSAGYTGAIRSFNSLVNGGTGYSSGYISNTNTNSVSGNGVAVTILINNSYGNLTQSGYLVEGDTYDVSLSIGGDTGSVFICIGDGDCQTFNAGVGNVSFSGVWHISDPVVSKISVSPSSDFNGTIDNVSVMSRFSKTPGLTIIDNNDMSFSLGVDNGEITQATGIKFTMGNGFTQNASASLFLGGESDSHYGYILPSLNSLGSSTSTDTFCMQYLGNCSMQSLSTAQRDALSSPIDNQIIFNTDTKTMQYYTAANLLTLVTAQSGVPAQAYTAMGETFTPTNTGVLNSISGTFAGVLLNGTNDGLKADIVARIYDAPNGNLLASSDNIVTDNDLDTVSEVVGTWTFENTNITLQQNTQYYIEFSDTDSVKNNLYFDEVSGDQYSEGRFYFGTPGNTGIADIDLDLAFSLSYGASSGSWSDVAGSGVQWNSNDNGIDYHDGNVGVGTTTPTAGLGVVGGGVGIGFSQVAWYNDVNTWSMDAVVSGDKLYALDGAHLDIFDISNPTSEHQLTLFDFSQFGVIPNVVRVEGDIAYVGGGTYVYVFDVSYSSQGQTPVLLGSYSSGNGGNINDLQIKNGVLYVIDSNSNFYTLDVSNISINSPSDPVFGAYSSPGLSTVVKKLSISGNYVYLSDVIDGIEVFDISDPLNPVYVSTYSKGTGDSFSGGIATKGNYVYATRDTNDGQSFVVLDATDPLNLVQVGYVDIGAYRIDTRITISGNIAYVADGAADSIYAINISYPTNPIIIGHGRTYGNSYAVAPYKDKLFVADGAFGIVVLSAPINYSALFNGGNVGIGTNDPAFNLDVGAKKATAVLRFSSSTINGTLDNDGFDLVDSSGSTWSYEFDYGTGITGGQYSISVGQNKSDITLSKVIDNTVQAINDSGNFLATRVGNTVSIEQLIIGGVGNRWNDLFNDDYPLIHPTHTSSSTYIILTDFIGGTNGDINFGGALYQNGQLFSGSQWTDTVGGIAYVGNVSIGEGSFYYDNTTGITSIDNLSLGALTFPEDAGSVSWIDMPISGNASDGTLESYTASIGGLSVITIHGEMSGGSLSNTGVRIEHLPTSDIGQLSFLCMNSTNELVVGTNSDCSSSSLRFKDNVNTLTDDSGLSEVMKLNPVSFFYKPEFNGALQANPNYNGEQVGFIAEEVGSVDPRLVTIETDGTTIHGVRYEKITAILVKAVKEIGATIAGFADNFFSKKVTTDKLCVGTICVTQAEFLHMIESSGTTPVPSEDPALAPEVVPTDPVQENIIPDPNISIDPVLPEDPTPMIEAIPPVEIPVTESAPIPVPDLSTQ